MTGYVNVEFEYMLRTSNKILYTFLSTPDGLQEWFADKVNFTGGEFEFTWDDETAKAKLVNKKNNESIKFEFTDEERKGNTLEFRINTDALTKELALNISDFCLKDEEKSNKQLWDFLVNNLKTKLGA
jgi:uncharacterized protein YndB with AHSA1/START domain